VGRFLVLVEVVAAGGGAVAVVEDGTPEFAGDAAEEGLTGFRGDYLSLSPCSIQARMSLLVRHHANPARRTSTSSAPRAKT
jgi:hypothetical protein